MWFDWILSCYGLILLFVDVKYKILIGLLLLWYYSCLYCLCFSVCVKLSLNGNGYEFIWENNYLVMGCIFFLLK